MKSVTKVKNSGYKTQSGDALSSNKIPIVMIIALFVILAASFYIYFPVSKPIKNWEIRYILTNIN